MRIYFNSMARPKRVARTLQDIFPLEKLSQCQAWAARIYGYRDWHELTQVTASGQHTPSPDDDDLPKDEAHRRNSSLWCTAQEVLDIGLADSVYVLPRLKLTSRAPVPSARRAPKIPKGENPFYQLIQTDLLGGGGREGNASSVDDYHAYTVVPAHYGSESEYRAKLIKLIKRRAKPYPGFAQDCEKLLASPCPEQTQFEWEHSEIGNGAWMTQWEQQRLYLFDRDLNPVGFIELTQTLSASSDAPHINQLELRVHEAWAIPDAWTLLSDIAATTFSGTVTQVFVSWRPTQPQPLGLTLISDSEFLFSRNFLRDVADLAADQLEIPREKIDYGYDV